VDVAVRRIGITGVLCAPWRPIVQFAGVTGEEYGSPGSCFVVAGE
jgi:hypothetical protein